MSQDPGVDDVAAALQMSIGLCIRQLRQMQAQGDLSLPEVSALKRLDRSGPTSVTELATAEQISVQSMGTTLTALEHVASSNDIPSERRAAFRSFDHQVRHTGAGRQAHRAGRAAGKDLSTGFSPAELRQLMAAAPLIERLAQSL